MNMTADDCKILALAELRNAKYHLGMEEVGQAEKCLWWAKRYLILWIECETK